MLRYTLCVSVPVQAAEERATRENNSLVERNQRLVREVQEQMASNARLVADNKQKAIELKQKEESIRAVQAETAKVVKAKEAAQARAKAIEKQKEEAELVNDQLRQGHGPALHPLHPFKMLFVALPEILPRNVCSCYSMMLAVCSIFSLRKGPLMPACEAIMVA